MLTSETLDAAAGAQLFFKCENLQKVGAFKARGATNAVFSLTDAGAGRGVATHSSGNHAAALARDCGWAGLMIELSESAVELAHKKFAANPRVTAIAERVTPGNVNQLLASRGW